MAAPIKATHWKKFLFHFAGEHLDFKLPELKSIASIFNIHLDIDEVAYSKENPFLVVGLLSEEDAKRIMTRTVLIRSVCELWAEGNGYLELCNNIENIPTAIISSFLSSEFTFKINVGSFNKKISSSEKIKKIESLPLDDLTRTGTVNLTSPDHTFVLQEYYGPGEVQATDNPDRIYFGRWITDGQRDRIQDYHLQHRHFLGNTSMDAGLSLIMANMAKVKNNSLVFDPFVGTGSLLVACAHFGSYVMGTDIDYPLLHAKAKPSRHSQKTRAADESIRSNLRQYGFESRYVDALVADASKHCMWRHQSMFDVIVTDPPYGIREAAQKIGRAAEDYIIDNDVRGGHVAQRSQYALSDIFKDLLNFAATFLRLHGRIVYWLPVVRQEYCEANVPQHPCLELISNCEQILNTKVARRLITMEKSAECTDIENSAGYDLDHYSEVSFRERYFHKSNLDHVDNSCDSQPDHIDSNRDSNRDSQPDHIDSNRDSQPDHIDSNIDSNRDSQPDHIDSNRDSQPDHIDSNRDNRQPETVDNNRERSSHQKLEHLTVNDT